MCVLMECFSKNCNHHRTTNPLLVSQSSLTLKKRCSFVEQQQQQQKKIIITFLPQGNDYCYYCMGHSVKLKVKEEMAENIPGWTSLSSSSSSARRLSCCCCRFVRAVESIKSVAHMVYTYKYAAWQKRTSSNSSRNKHVDFRIFWCRVKSTRTHTYISLHFEFNNRHKMWKKE